MTQEDKELLLKDLCARLPYGVKCAYFDTKNEIKVGELLTVWCKEKRVFIDNVSIDYDGGDCIGVIPYLFPLSSRTDEQKKESSFESSLLNAFINGYISQFEDGELNIDDLNRLYDWLNKNHFDYRGLIEKGLAIDATGLNIY